MADKDNSSKGRGDGNRSGNKEDEIECMQECLEGWKQVLLEVDKVMTWQQQWYAFAIGGFVTLVFVLIWWLEPSVLTTISMFAMAVCLLDYFVPALSSKFFASREWTSSDQGRLQQICISLVEGKRSVVGSYDGMLKMREEKPKQYFMVSVSLLTVMAFIGNLFPNLLLCYFFFLFLALLPGLQHRRLLSKYSGNLLGKLEQLIKKKKE